MRAPVLAVVIGACLIAPATAQKPAPGADTPEWVARQIDQRDTGRDSPPRDDDAPVRPSGARARALARAHLASRRRRPRRSRARAVSQPRRHQRHRPSRLGTSRRPTTSAFCICPRSAACAASPDARSRRASSEATCRYEDIGGRELDDYTYAFVQRDATWTGPDGVTLSGLAARVESQSTRRRSYPRTVSLVRKDNFVVVAADIFNRRNEREKRYDVRASRADRRRLDRDGRRHGATSCERTRTELIVTQRALQHRPDRGATSRAARSSRASR